ncbi:MAG: MFS transporter [Proteobacteria bacterium]|nr:MFS transporter [Pseudomonadota bacterium]
MNSDNPQSAPNKRLLFVLSNLAIFMIGLGFAVRTSIVGDLQGEVFDVLDLARSATMAAEVLAATFIGFALTLLFGAALVDLVGMRRMLLFAAFGYFFGSAMVVAASLMSPSMAAYWLIYAGLLLTGLGWGAVEAATNPLVAAAYPEEKTHRLNILHAWWPAGIVIGGLIGIFIAMVQLPWQANLLVLMAPAVVLVVMVRRADFPVSERVAMGLSYQEMFRQLYRSPGFWIWFICMMGTVTAELAPSQWVNVTLTNVVGMSGLWVLIYINVIIFVGRHFAGPLVSRLSTPGLLTMGCALAAPGLYFLGIANSPMAAFAAATLWAVGICYFYPTMIGAVAERYPAGGALMIGLMGFAGGLATQFLLPVMGRVFDEAKIAAAGGVAEFSALQGDALADVVRMASTQSFQIVAVIPLVLIPVFAVLWVIEKRRPHDNA